MKTTPLLVVLAVIVPGTTTAQPQPAPCDSPEAHRFDFWIGDWDIHQQILQPDGSQGRRNHLDRALAHGHAPVGGVTAACT